MRVLQGCLLAVLLVSHSSRALSDDVYCTTPYEDACPGGPYYNSTCQVSICLDWNSDGNITCADKEYQYPGTFEEPEVYHIGLQVVTEPGIVGSTVWTVGTVSCGKERQCKTLCVKDADGIFQCMPNTNAVWNHYNENFLTASGDTCSVTGGPGGPGVHEGGEY